MWSSRPLLKTVLLSATIGTFFLSCAGTKNSSSRPEKNGPGGSGGDVDVELQFEGTVRYLQVEGGAWVIESTEGTTYDPTNLPERYKEKGLPVRVWADQVEDAVSIRMVGPIISIKRIEQK